MTVSGEGYQPSERVSVTYETGLSSPPSVTICITTANSAGSGSLAWAMSPPRTPGGYHEIRAKGKTPHATARTTFTLS